LEIDGGEGTYQALFTINNVTLKSDLNAVGGKYADFRSNAQGAVNNIYAYNFKPTSYVRINKDDVAQNYLDGKLTFSNWQIALPTGVTDVTSLFQDHSESGLAPNFGAASASWSTAITLGNETTGCDVSVFGWTYAFANGAY
jgi:hypothetical protein